MTFSVEHLSFEYNKGETLIKDVSLQLNNGINILLGKNGSGKTTLLNCLINFYDTYNGSIVINGIDVKKMSERQIAKYIAYVPQNTECRIEYTVYEFLLTGRLPHIPVGKNISQADCQIVDKYSQITNITHLFNKSIQQLSGGERQLVLLTRAFIQKTPFIILDEPFSALDMGNQHMSMEILRNISAQESKCFFMTTHNPNHALFLNAYVFLFKKGEIINKGKAEDMIRPSILSDIYEGPVTYSKNLQYDEISFG